MEIRQTQAQVDAWIEAHGGYWDVMCNLARLTEEVGELARALNHHHGAKTAKPGEPDGNIAEELADVLWVVVCLANQLDVDLQTAFGATMDKIGVRDANRHR